MAKPRTIFMGTGDIGLPTLRWLFSTDALQLVGVVTQPDRPVGRSQRLHASGPKRLAQEKGVITLQPVRLRRPEAVESLRELRPELIVVMAYGQILPKAVLNLPPLACLNLHASLLPKHRGAAPVQAAILAGDRETGITVMHMAEGLDTGDVVLSHGLVIGRRETGERLHDRLAELAPVALAEALQRLLSGTAGRLPQDEAKATYAPKLERDSGKMDWSQDCWHLDRFVRAMYPWPGAYTEVQDAAGERRRLKVHRAVPLHRRTGEAGAVLGTGARGIVVGCGEGALLVLDVQLEGRRRLPASEFGRGARVAVGNRWGPGQ
ncbi:MAG TPA: methionyl-tRNA formyltransferase [Chthoniobacterales bacterium]